MDRWLREDRAATSRLTAAEVASAAHRRAREGALPARGLRRVLDALEADVERYVLVEAGPPVVSRATALLARHPLRALDAVHLASALELREELGHRVEFVCFDAALAAAARSEGLPVLGA